MKLYTEEQVIEAMKLARHTYDTKDEIFKRFTPIELPSDEEIGKDIGSGMHDFYKGGFIEGAKWIKEQILNQNK